MRYLVLFIASFPLALFAQNADSVDTKASQITAAKLQAWQRNSYDPMAASPTFTSHKPREKELPKGRVTFPSSRGPYMFGFTSYYSPMPYGYDPYAYPSQMGYGGMVSPYFNYPVYSPQSFVGNILVSAGLDYLFNPSTRARFKKKE